MKPKSWILAGLIFTVLCGLWSAYILSRRAFLRDFNGGVHAYLAGRYTEAEDQLRKALDRRPRDEKVKQVLIKSLIEQSFALYHQKNFNGALETLERAARITPSDPATQEALASLREQLAVPEDKQPQSIEKVLAEVYHQLPDPQQPRSLESIMDRWLQRSEKNQEAALKRFWDNQERWLGHLQHEKDDFKRILYGGLFLFGLGGLILFILLLGVLHTYFGRRGIFSQLLEAHYQRLLSALPAGTQVLLGPPMSLLHVPEAHQMDAIEAELKSGGPAEGSYQQLTTFLEGENPWVRARAAKILYRTNPALALSELKRLVQEGTPGTQLPGMWALSELATAEALDILAPLAYSPIREIQQGTIRSLLQLQAKENLPPEVSAQLNRLLTEIRSKTGWIF